MSSPAHHSKPILDTVQAMLQSGLTLICVLALLGSAAGAQTFTVLHNFTGGGDGASPKAGLTNGCGRELIWDDLYWQCWLWGCVQAQAFRLWLGADAPLQLR